jgi:VWFA-related protein
MLSRSLAPRTLMTIATPLVAVLLLQPANLALQQASSSDPTTDGNQSPQPAVFTSRSDLVVLNLSVKGKKGGYVPDLTADAFAVFESKQIQPISFFIRQDAPVTVGLLVDSSGSMSANRELVIAAATSFAATSNPEDEIFALAFNDSVSAVLPESMPFTADPDALRRAMSAHRDSRPYRVVRRAGGGLGIPGARNTRAQGADCRE